MLLTYKNEYLTEPYVSLVINKQHRSILSQFRCGVLPLKIETGRYQAIPPEFRICPVCDDDSPETEAHFMLHCNKYNEIRNDFLLSCNIDNFDSMSDDVKMKTLMSKVYVNETASFLFRCYDIRTKSIYPCD